MTEPLSNGKAVLLKATEDVAAAQDELRMLRKRQNEQMVVYLLVCSAIVVAWMLGSWQFSFVWAFVVALFTLVIWRSKVLTLTERNLQYKETVLHRQRSLRQSESAEWLNFLLNRWLIFTGNGVGDFLKKHLNPRLNNGKPSFIENIELESLHLGGDSPVAKFVRMYECTDGVGGGKVPLTWTSVNGLPHVLGGANLYQLVMEMKVEMHSDDCAMVFRTRLGGKWVGMTLNIAVEKLYVKGHMQVLLQLNRDVPFPHVASATLSFLDKPEINFGIRALKIIDIMEMPLLKSWINSIVRQGIFDALVDPGKFVVDLRTDSVSYAVSSQMPVKTRAAGVLTVIVRGEYVSPSSGQSKKDRKGSKTNTWGWDLANETRECFMTVGSQSAPVVTSNGQSAFTAIGSFVINDLKQDKLIIKTKSKFILASQTVAKFEVALHSLPFDKQRGSCVIPLEKQLDKVFGGDTMRLSIAATYSSLPDVDKIMDLGRIHLPSAVDTVSGVLFVCIHSATNLLAINEQSLSNPYCVVYCNGKKVARTHYVKKTKSPKWDVSAEFIVEDVSKSCLLFAIYNWNGHQAVEDEFLGAVQVSLSSDEPVLIRKNISLVNSALGIHHGTNEVDHLGKVAVSSVFRPVAAVSESVGISATVVEPVERAKSQKSVVSHSGKSSVKSSARENSVASLGVVELSIIRAKDLAALDSNGYSDPFCEVLVSGRKVYTTSVQKKTLSPVWNESVTTDVPAMDEKLEIMLYDHDVITKNDFLGSVTFTLEDLKKIASNVQHDGWFPLQHRDSQSAKERTGSVQLRIKVFLDESQMFKDVAAAITQTVTAVVKVPMTSSDQVASEVRKVSSAPANSKNSVVPKAGKQSADVSVVTLASVLGAPPPASSGSPPSNDKLEPAGDNTAAAAGGSFKLPRKSPGSTPVRRIGSESRLNGEETDTQLPPEVQSGLKKSTSAFGIGNIGNSEYRGVRGILRSIKGVSDSTTTMYCKIRLQTNAGPGDKVKKASAGNTIAKSQSVVPKPRLELNLEFDVDHGYGVSRNSWLIFDIKSGHFSHIATQMYTLQQLLGDEGKPSTQWLPLDGGVEIKVQMMCEGIQPSSATSRRSHSFIGSLRGLKKIKET